MAGTGTDPIFHIAVRAEWDAQLDSPGYRPDAFAGEGFVHCSTVEQLGPTTARHFPGRDDLVLLTLDPERLTADLRWEPSPSTGELFPHVYGAIDREAIVETVDWPPADGSE
jgi:uncharacterized protein (DUF952 family)